MDCLLISYANIHQSGHYLTNSPSRKPSGLRILLGSAGGPSCLLSLGIARIEHTDTVEKDSLLCSLLGLKKLPQKSTFYRGLERFDQVEKVHELFAINAGLLQNILHDSKLCILDLDTTVETVHGQQQGTTRGYNPRYRGRHSYQPLLAFDGNSKAVLNAQLRNGYTPTAKNTMAFYQKTEEALPAGTEIKHLRADHDLGSDKFLNTLEAD